MTKILLRTCPVCNSKEGEVLHTQKFVLPEGSPLPTEYDIVSCTNCGFTFADTSVPQQAYDLYYELLSKYEDKKTATGGGYNEYDLDRITTTVNEIMLSCPDKNAAILDIGCANGGILKRLKENSYKNLMGLDPSKVCVEDVQNSGISCVKGSLFNAEKTLGDQKFDYVILSHVLEHIYDLKKAFTECFNLLKENGKFYIEVPDASSYHNFYVIPYYYFDSEHINHFDEDSLSNLGIMNNFSKYYARQKKIPASSTQLYPALFVIFEKNKLDNGISPVISFSTKAKESVCEYVKASTQNTQAEIIEKLIKSNEDVLVFGAGNFTLRLLATTDLATCNIKGFIDNDHNKQGRLLEGKPILAPKVLNDFTGTLLVCSALFAKDIEIQARSINEKLRIIVLS